MDSYSVGIGETFVFPFQMTDDSGNPVDLTTGHTLSFKILVQNSPGTAAVYTSAPTGDAQGNVTITIASSTTATFTEGTYVMLLTDTASGVTTWLLRARLIVTEASRVG